jgi:hypothetical protein
MVTSKYKYNHEVLLWKDPNSTSKGFSVLTALHSNSVNHHNISFSSFPTKPCAVASTCAGHFQTPRLDSTSFIPEEDFESELSVWDSDSCPDTIFSGLTRDPFKDRENSSSMNNSTSKLEESLQPKHTRFRWASHFKPFGVLCYVLKEPRERESE